MADFVKAPDLWDQLCQDDLNGKSLLISLFVLDKWVAGGRDIYEYFGCGKIMNTAKELYDILVFDNLIIVSAPSGFLVIKDELDENLISYSIFGVDKVDKSTLPDFTDNPAEFYKLKNKENKS